MSVQDRFMNIANALMSVSMSDALITSLEGGAPRLLSAVTAAASDLRAPVKTLGDQLQTIRRAAIAVNDVAARVSSFTARATSLGVKVPSNPFLDIMRFNRSRVIRRLPDQTVTVSPDSVQHALAERVISDVQRLLDLMQEVSGQIISPSNPQPQISSFDMSFAGFDIPIAGGGTDLLQFMPDAEKIRRRRVKSVLEALNFDRREPRLLFTMNLDKGQERKGCVVGWMKIPDASGYIVTRKNVVNGSEKEFSFTKESIEKRYVSVKDHVDFWIPSFYDNAVRDRIVAFLDEGVVDHRLYTYTLQAYQNIRTDRVFVFDVDSSPLLLSPVQIVATRREIEGFVEKVLAPSIPGAGADDVSPYPFISRKLYGHDSYDWMIAAANVLAAIRRREDKEIVKKFSYVGAKWSFIESELKEGRLVKPADTSVIADRISESIGTYGLSQTITELIEATGLDFALAPAEDTQQDNVASHVDTFGAKNLSVIEMILSAIDPETATLDLGILTSNMITTLGSSSGVDAGSHPSEVVDPESAGTQFIGDFSDLVDDVIDLASFDGISKFMRAVRSFFDLAFGRSLTPEEPTDPGPSDAPNPDPGDLDPRQQGGDIGGGFDTGGNTGGGGPIA